MNTESRFEQEEVLNCQMALPTSEAPQVDVADFYAFCLLISTYTNDQAYLQRVMVTYLIVSQLGDSPFSSHPAESADRYYPMAFDSLDQGRTVALINKLDKTVDWFIAKLDQIPGAEGPLNSDYTVIDRITKHTRKADLDKPNLRKDDGFLSRVKMVLEESYDKEELDLDFLSNKLALSHRPLQRKFKNLLGCSPMAYVKKFRIEKAKVLLLETKKTITDIAGEAGFNSSNYFARSFKELESVTPRQYRENHAAIGA